MEMQAGQSRAVGAHRDGMIWVEVTNGCNLLCQHCYSDSYPGSHCRDTLSHEDYIRIIEEASEASFSTIQLIGGEPFLYKKLDRLIVLAQSLQFENIEIFSNLSIPRPDLIEVIDATRTRIATSVYSDNQVVHDRITKKRGSFTSTMNGIRSVVDAGIYVRAGFIEMEENSGHFDRTKEYVTQLGVRSVGFDRVRGFGRGGQLVPPSQHQLCGACSGNTICVTYDGLVAPCIMSRAWPIGSIVDKSLSEIVMSSRSTAVRASIASATAQYKSAMYSRDGISPARPSSASDSPENLQQMCDPQCIPWCSPGQSCTPCNPNGAQPCAPNCYPTGNWEPTRK